MRVSYAEWGDAAAERTVVCVHGLSRNCRDFDVIAARLAAAGMRVVAPDLPGRGRSDWLDDPDEYATPLYMSAMTALIARLDVAEVDWIGSSLGGHIGMEIAALPGSPIKSLVLNDFGARVTAASLHRIAGYLTVARSFRDLDEVEAYLRTVHSHFGALTDAQWRHLATHSAAEERRGTYRLRYDPAIAKQFAWPLMLDINLWHVWEKVDCRVLILRGVHSDLLLPRTVREMLERGRAAEAHRVEAEEIADCGHAPALMDDAVIARVERFFASVHANRTEPARVRRAVA